MDVPLTGAVVGVEAELFEPQLGADGLAFARLEGETNESLKLDGTQRLVDSGV